MCIRQQTLMRITSLWQDTLLCKITAGARYGARAYIFQGYGVTDMELNSPQCILLALLNSLVMEDVMSCCFLADVCHHLQELQLDYLGVWLAGGFVFPCQDIEKAMTFLSQLLDAETLKLPDHMTRIMTSLANKYGIQLRSPSTEGHGDPAITFEAAAVNDSPGDIIALPCEVGEVNSLNSCDATPLEEAVRNNNASSVKALLSAGANTEKLFMRGNTCLHIAAGGGHNEALSALLEGGTDVNRMNYAEETPLFIAFRARNVRGVELLLEKGANARIVPGGGKNLLETVLESKDIEMFKALVRFGADININNGDTLCHLAALGENFEMLKAIQDMTLPGNYINNDGIPPLHLATIMKFLIRKGFDANARTRKGETALHLASARGLLELVRTLCQEGAAVNARDNEGASALMIAIKNTKDDVVKCLLRNGADPNISQDCITALHYAAERGSLGIVTTLLEAGARVNARAEEVGTALHSAALGGHTEVVVALLDHGANIEDRLGWKKFNRFTPLMLASRDGLLGVVQLLVGRGAELNAKDGRNFTAFSYATLNGRSAVADYLRSRGGV